MGDLEPQFTATCRLIPYPFFRVPNFMVLGSLTPKLGNQKKGYGISLQVCLNLLKTSLCLSSSRSRPHAPQAEPCQLRWCPWRLLTWTSKLQLPKTMGLLPKERVYGHSKPPKIMVLVQKQWVYGPLYWVFWRSRNLMTIWRAEGSGSSLEDFRIFFSACRCYLETRM